MTADLEALRKRIEYKMTDAENDGHLTLCRLMRAFMDAVLDRKSA
jgi:hypothetical protein